MVAAFEHDINIEPALSGENAWLNVLVVYEDFATGMRAKRAFDHLLDRFGDKAAFKVNLWRFDLLGDLEFSARAAGEAAAADIVVLSAHGRSDLPVDVKIWLGRWLSKRDKKSTALVLSLDQNDPNSGDENRILPFLQSLAVPANVEIIPHFL